MQVKKTVENARKIIEFATKEGWSEEELAKAIRLLHSELEYLSQSIEIL